MAISSQMQSTMAARCTGRPNSKGYYRLKPSSDLETASGSETAEAPLRLSPERLPEAPIGEAHGRNRTHHDAVRRAIGQLCARHAGRPHGCVPRTAWARAQDFAFRVKFPRQHLRDEIAGRAADYFAERRRLIERGAPAAGFFRGDPNAPPECRAATRSRNRTPRR